MPLHSISGSFIQGHKLEIFASWCFWKITDFPALFQFRCPFPELASSCGGIRQRVSTVPFVSHHSLVAVGPRTAVAAVAMGTPVGQPQMLALCQTAQFKLIMQH